MKSLPGSVKHYFNEFEVAAAQQSTAQHSI
jgi:hypothetical protein